MKHPASDHPLVTPDLMEALLLAQAEIRPEPERAQGLKARLLEQVRAERSPTPALLTVRADSGEWIRLGPKVEMKILRQDRDSRCFLLRLLPGGVLPPHEHPMDEECLVLEGEAELGGVRVRAGDFHLAPKGVPHGLVRSRTGALLYLRGANPAHYSPG